MRCGRGRRGRGGRVTVGAGGIEEGKGMTLKLAGCGGRTRLRERGRVLLAALDFVSIRTHRLVRSAFPASPDCSSILTRSDSDY
jgi:hypothetical protein